MSNSEERRKQTSKSKGSKRAKVKEASENTKAKVRKGKQEKGRKGMSSGRNEPNEERNEMNEGRENAMEDKNVMKAMIPRRTKECLRVSIEEAFILSRTPMPQSHDFCKAFQCVEKISENKVTAINIHWRKKIEAMFFEARWRGKLFQMKFLGAAIDSVKFSSKSEPSLRFLVV